MTVKVDWGDKYVGVSFLFPTTMVNQYIRLTSSPCRGENYDCQSRDGEEVGELPAHCVPLESA